MLFRFRIVEAVNHLESVTTQYEGFTHKITRANVKNHTLVIAWLDGEEAEYWVVEGEEGIKELERLYMDEVGEIPEFTRFKHDPNGSS